MANSAAVRYHDMYKQAGEIRILLEYTDAGSS